MFFLAQSSKGVIEPAEIHPRGARPIEVPQTKTKEIQFQSKEIQLQPFKKNQRKLKPLSSNKLKSFPLEDEFVQCDICMNKFPDEIQLRDHQQMHFTYKCQFCVKTFHKSSNLECHERTHTSELPFVCKYCKRAFNHVYICRKHSEKCDLKNVNQEVIRFKCSYCPITFALERKRINHECKHGIYKCPKCFNNFKSRSSLESHLRVITNEERVNSIHVDQIEVEPKSSIEHNQSASKKFTCKYCSKNFDFLACLRTHFKMHKNFKPFKCNYCSASFNRNYARVQHERLHTEDNPHKCPKCLRSFQHKKSILKHLKQNTCGKPVLSTNSLSNEERITSELLSKEISLDHQANGDISVDKQAEIPLNETIEIPVTKKSFREIHRRKRTDGKLVRYRNRFISFSSDKYRVRHELIRTGKIYKCPKCLKRFHTKYSFMKHVKRNSCGKGIKSFQVQNTDEVQQKSDECSNTDVLDNELPMASEKHTDTSGGTIQCLQLDGADQIERGSETQCETTDLLTSVEQQGNSLPNVEKEFTSERSHKSTLESETRNSKEIQLEPSTNNQAAVKIPMDTQHRRKIHTIVKPFKCSYCPTSFNVKHRLISHERNHTGEIFFEWLNAKLPNYPHDFVTKNAQKQKGKNGKKIYECPNCACKCEGKWSLNRHLKRKEFCKESKKDDQQSDSKHDEENNTGNVKIIQLPLTSEANFLLEIEPEETELDANLPEYQQLEDHCESNETMSQDDLNDDNDDESIEDIFVKEEPRLDFDYEQAFQVNDQSSDENNLIEAPNNSPDEQNIQSPNQAIQTFGRILPIACIYCGERFINRIQCDIHEESCSRFKCFFCPLKFEQIDDRNQHHQTHTDTKSLVCEFCSKSFNREYSLKLHRRIHTGEKPFECEICQKRFTLKQGLIYHRKTHDINGENYPCDRCNKVYKYNRSLLRHQLGKHKT